MTQASSVASESDISDRIQLLTDIANSLLSEGVLPAEDVVLRGARIPVMVRGYFLLNRAYKDWRITDGHNTEKPKIAALQSAVISTIQPFRPISPADVRTFAQARCNEVYALTYALSILEVDLKPDTPQKRDLWLRILDIISACRIETIEAYIQDVNHQIPQDLEKYTLSVLPTDQLAINSLITIFELLSDKHNLQKTP